MRNLWMWLPLLAACSKAPDESDTDADADTDTDSDTDTDVDTDVPPALGLVGTWVDATGRNYEINETRWVVDTEGYGIAGFTDTWVLAHNDATNTTNPGRWSRFDYLVADDRQYFCHTGDDAESQAAAHRVEAADASDLATGCLAGSWTELRSALSITGGWQDDAGVYFWADAFVWSDSSGSTYAVSQADDAAMFLVAQNGVDNPENANLWSRFDWKVDGSTLWYCQTATAAANEAAALATARGDDADPENSGCGAGGWTPARTLIDIDGFYSDEFGGTLRIDSWDIAYNAEIGSSLFHISQFDNPAHVAIAQNDAENGDDGLLWSRFDWTFDIDLRLWYCQTANNAASEAEALATPAADDTDLVTGCEGGAWFVLSRLR